MPAQDARSVRALTTPAASDRSAARLRLRQLLLWQRVVAARLLWLMFAPGFLLLVVFSYGPIYGLLLAFKDYNISDGILGSPWVGLRHFQEFFGDPLALRAVRNTVVISLLRLVFGFPAPVILALLFNELADSWFKRSVQSVSYLPHFISWIIIAGMVSEVLSPETGIVNQLIKLVGLQPVYFMTSETWFVPVVIVSDIWKEVGWGTVIYLAALAGVDPTLYEAAVVDGASRLQRMWLISLPSIMPVVGIVLILSMGGILNGGFDQIFNMYNPQVYDVADIIDTYVYRVGLVGMEYSFATAVGLFKSLVGLILLVVVNLIVRRTNPQYALW
ncbi:MAG TPA: ABC transporter permease subunit [Chloroflexota bacterium]|nr:ABC transporter permease subunit [Chloroflexota bacterium]